MDRLRFLRLRAEAEGLFARLNGKDTTRAAEAAQALYEFATSPDQTVFNAFTDALDSKALRAAARSPMPDIQHTVSQIIGLTETRCAGRDGCSGPRIALETIEHDNRTTEASLLAVEQAKNAEEKREVEIDMLHALLDLPAHNYPAHHPMPRRS